MKDHKRQVDEGQKGSAPPSSLSDLALCLHKLCADKLLVWGSPLTGDRAAQKSESRRQA